MNVCLHNFCIFFDSMVMYQLAGWYNAHTDLDNTADIQLHSWGDSLELAFANIIPCMFNYMTDLSTVEEDEAPIMIEAQGEKVECLIHVIPSPSRSSFTQYVFIPILLRFL